MARVSVEERPDVAARVLARTIQSDRKLPIQVYVLLPATPTFPSAFRDPGNSQSLITTSITTSF
jgi:hypothetical protein